MELFFDTAQSLKWTGLRFVVACVPYHGALDAASAGHRIHSAADANCKTAKRQISIRRFRRSSTMMRKEKNMAVTDAFTLERLRREESLAERQGRQALNIAAILKNFPQYDAARQKADALLAKASALREQIVKIESA
jgi:hypothetical protein